MEQVQYFLHRTGTVFFLHQTGTVFLRQKGAVFFAYGAVPERWLTFRGTYIVAVGKR